MLDDYLKTNPGAIDLPRPGIEPQPPNPQSDAITIRPRLFALYGIKLNTYCFLFVELLLSFLEKILIK